MTWLREPLLHFAVAGAILFGAYSWLSGENVETSAAEPVRIGEGDVRWLKETWSSQWLREPTADELKELVSELLKEKLLEREAREMGLEEDDTIIRRRLAQKLQFLVEDTAQLADPTDDELRRFHAANAARFETPGKVSFKQAYFNPEQRQDAQGDAVAALAELKAKGGSDAIVGDRLLFGDSYVDTDELALSQMFGADFAQAVFGLEPGEWQGPVKSGYGLHLVQVTKRTATELRPFEAVREDVVAEWRKQKQAELTDAYLAELRRKYGVELDDGVEAGLRLEPAASVAAQ